MINTNAIRNRVNGAVSDDDRTGEVARLLRAQGTQLGISMNKQQVDEHVAFIHSYVKSTADILDNTIAAARAVGVANHMEPIMHQVAAYWDEQYDFIPDIAERSGLSEEELRGREVTTTTKRDRRVGEFEWTWLRRAASLNAPTDIALTFADYLDAHNMAAQRFEQLRPETMRFIEEVEPVATAPVSLIATRFHSRSIIDRRYW